MTKERPLSHELEQYSRGMFLARFSNWVVNSLVEADYAFDFEVRPTGRFVNPSEVRQSPFYVQLKASEQFDDPQSVWYDLDTSELAGDFLSASIPAVLCIYERSSDQFNWCVLQPYCWDVLDERNPDWRSQSKVRIRTDRDPLGKDGGKQRLMQAVAQAQRRISMRASIASQRRDAFVHPPGAVLASTGEVQTHKRDLVEDARRLAEAGHLDRALRQFMQVFQLPEDDRPTLEAVCYLLALRSITAPHIAFGKLQIANHGAALAEALDEPEFKELLEGSIDRTCEYIENVFIGARYRHHPSGRDCLVLDVVNRGPGTGKEALWVATLQDSMGDIETETAEALSGGDEYELLESGVSTNPRADACPEREHEFHLEELGKYPPAAVCSLCGLRHGVVRDWLGHNVPEVCDRCDSVGYELEYRAGETLCHICAGN